MSTEMPCFTMQLQTLCYTADNIILKAMHVSLNDILLLQLAVVAYVCTNVGMWQVYLLFF